MTSRMTITNSASLRSNPQPNGMLSLAPSIRTCCAVWSRESTRLWPSAAERVEVSANSCFTVHAALNEPLRFKAGPHANQTYFTELMPASMNVLRQYFDALRYGRMPDTSLLGLGLPVDIR